MPNFKHSGLYFTAALVKTARDHQTKAPFAAAWDLLNTPIAPAAPVNDADLLMQAFRYRVAEDQSSGHRVAQTLMAGYGLDLSIYTTHFDALAALVTITHAAELIRDHTAFVPNHAAWAAQYTAACDQLQTLPDNAPLVDHIWLGLLNLISGIHLEAEDRFEAGCATFRHTIDQIRPEGYLTAAVEGGDPASFQRQFLVVAALTCMAEAASLVGVDLWNYNFRGISVSTAAAYITYYYYYPTQWRWATLAEDPTRSLFKQGGSFLEMVYHHAHPQDLKLLLDEQRPLFNPALGGLTTLTHALPPKERRGLFG